MQKILTFALWLFLFSIAPLFAQAESADSATSGAADQAQWDKKVEQWQARMNEIHRQMEEINRTTDPEKRRKLLEKHWELMDEQMLAMRMMGGGMMDHHMAGGRHSGGHRHMMDPETRARQMYDRMDMMHLMMEQMLYHQHMMIRDSRKPR